MSIVDGILLFESRRGEIWNLFAKIKEKDELLGAVQVTIKTNLLVALLSTSTELNLSNSSDRELPRDMFHFKNVWNYLG